MIFDVTLAPFALFVVVFGGFCIAVFWEAWKKRR